jgi:chromosomal replication initiation ATPase DnaA
MNGRYTFENFVVGASNRLACCLRGCQKRPAQAYNPCSCTVG